MGDRLAPSPTAPTVAGGLECASAAGVGCGASVAQASPYPPPRDVDADILVIIIQVTSRRPGQKLRGIGVRLDGISNPVQRGGNGEGCIHFGYGRSLPSTLFARSHDCLALDLIASRRLAHALHAMWLRVEIGGGGPSCTTDIRGINPAFCC